MSPFTVRHLLSSPAVRLIRKDHASFIISFLWRVFKEGDIFYIVYEEMLARLRSEIEDSATGDGEIAVTRSPDQYLNDWVDEGLLSKKYRIISENETVVVEPTKELTKVFSWIEDLRSLDKGESVGTESRFFSILHKLKEIVTESEQDPEQKIAVLETRKAEIEQETEEIRRTVAVRTLPEVRIRIQYLYARREAAELISDFRIVESNFADATREIHKKYLETSLKGEIIEFVLDQDQELFFKRLRGLLREAWSRVNSVVSELSEQLKRSVIDKTVHEISKFCTV